MDKANRQIDAYLVKLKQDFKEKVSELLSQEPEKICELLEYVWEYPKFTFTAEDSYLFLKKPEKRRMQNTGEESIQKQTNQQKQLPITKEEQCIAKRTTDGVQCVRKKKKGSNYCGTHAKIENKSTLSGNKMEVSAEDIHGIIYYIDNFNNVYHTEDILEGKENPRIIAKANRLPDNTFTIPTLFDT
jgi:hypothetical protein